MNSMTFDLRAFEEYVKYSRINLKDRLRASKGEKIGFIEGPPTMNGEPHIGHIRGRIMKDLWYRFKTLQGYNVIFRAGWDTQGLPVELQAERELGLTGSKLENLKKVGMEKLVEACKNLVLKYNKRWIEVDKMLGISLDHENAYWTFHDKYIEREWKYLKRAWEEGILVEDYAIVAYCPSCQTSLSHAEVNQGYEVVEDPSLYYKVRLVDEDAYIIVWTTMPFTVITDEMVGVKPDAEYLYISVNGEQWIVGKDRLEELMKELKIEEYSIISSIKGRDLEGKRYIHPLLDLIPAFKKFENIHFVVAEEFVDTVTGSGIVHLSPANGEEDFAVAKKRNIPIFNPIDDQVRFTDDAGIFAGIFVRDADKHVVEKLREANALVKIGRIKHEYPLCWRSKHKLVWLARREYFIMVNKIGDLALKAAEDVEYYYPEPKNRFLSIIAEQKPWCVSRERVWGAPLPIWVCSNCNHKNALFSRDEIIENAKVLPDGKEFELHRPWIDRVIIRCKKCNGDAYREPFVLDTWHNSGASPYASLSDEEFNELVPVPFLTEGIDQTRGWAYTLLIESVIMYNKAKAPYRSFLFQGHVLDEKGNKMSKSLGNVIDGYDIVKRYPADLIRLYFIWKASPIDPLSFSINEMLKRTYQILNTLYNLHIYFIQNSSYDKFDDSKHTISWAIENRLLRESELWLSSRLENVKEIVKDSYERCRYHEGARALENFIINDLSQTYLPLTRNELWSDDEESRDRRLAIYATLSHALLTIDIILHPISPFITDYLASTVFKKESILLEQWPESNKEFVNEELEKAFNIINNVISIANAARNKAGLKRRWPLSIAYIALKRDDAKLLRGYKDLLKNQMNVLDIDIVELSDNLIDNIITMLEHLIPINIRLSLKRASIAPRVKEDLKRVQAAFDRLEYLQIIPALKDRFMLAYDNKEVAITLDDVEIEYDAKEGYTLAERDGIFVFVKIERDEGLIAKGVARDLARRLQALRKERGYNPTDILNYAYITYLDDNTIKLLDNLLDEMAYLVRVKEVKILKDAEEGIRWSEGELDGKKILISVE